LKEINCNSKSVVSKKIARVKILNAPKNAKKNVNNTKRNTALRPIVPPAPTAPVPVPAPPTAAPVPRPATAPRNTARMVLEAIRRAKMEPTLILTRREAIPARKANRASACVIPSAKKEARKVAMETKATMAKAMENQEPPAPNPVKKHHVINVKPPKPKRVNPVVNQVKVANPAKVVNPVINPDKVITPVNPLNKLVKTLAKPVKMLVKTLVKLVKKPVKTQEKPANKPVKPLVLPDNKPDKPLALPDNKPVKLPRTPL